VQTDFLKALYPIIIILAAALENEKLETTNDMSLSHSIRFALAQASSGTQGSMVDSQLDAVGSSAGDPIHSQENQINIASEPAEC